MRIACLQHAFFEGPGNIAAWAEMHAHPLKRIHLCNGDALPDLNDFDLLVIMGGPMSVNDEADYAWLAPEKQLIRQCLEKDKFVLGVCLGSQLLANALGSRVYRNRVKEIGWFAVRRLAGSSFAPLPDNMEVFHWHGETYDLPAGCVHLAESEGCHIQAFEHSYALGLQFHLEVTEGGVKDLIRNCEADIGSGPYEQPKEKLIAGEVLHRDAMRTVLFGILDTIEVRLNQPR